MALSTFLRLGGRKQNSTTRQERQCRPGLAPLELRTVMDAAVLSVVANPTSLWPPNGRLVPVTVSGIIADDDGADIGAKFKVKDEYGTVQPRGPLDLSQNPDGTFSYSFTVMLEARRLGQDRDGRQYLIVVNAFDDDSTERGSTVVTVPHDQRKRGPVDHSGPHRKPNKSLPVDAPDDDGPGHSEDHWHRRRGKPGWGHHRDRGKG
jgi:hypothetical protein